MESNGTDTVIRPLRPQDQDTARRLILAGMAEHWGAIDATCNPDLKDIVANYAGATFLLAWQGDALVGTGALIHEAEVVARVVRMSVARAMRRRGIGRLILQHLLERARAAGYCQV
ncbi:MAG TPA: GNAT family N-acetyltransferase, partial [Anaerolineae bacterium]|nr:GNAT family N-acetyltransferase [Anaerolineae bacterium]